MLAPFSPAEFRKWLGTRRLGHALTFLATTTSTQDVARQLAEEGAAEGAIVVADEQTAGRGRKGRPWISPAGANLYFTLILRPEVEKLRKLSMAAPLAVAEALDAQFDLHATIKWPNDVLVGGKKISGILIDAESSGVDCVYVLVGIGINVNFDPRRHPEVAGVATSVLAVSGRAGSREALLAGVLARLEHHYDHHLDVYEQWKARLVGLGEAVVVQSADALTNEGVAQDVNEDGSLLLRLPDGSLVALPAGELVIPHAGP
jgi:BirA family transcriptional regulator, biotin operon repressor / biotin---[acetyl-CoA-carboxylase] ligase